MAQTTFSPEWLNQFSDPYAVLGVSVVADDRRVLKRYHTVAKQLHPDSFTDTNSQTKQLASQILSHLVNPAYQKLKLDKNRADMLATLRVRARLLNRQESFRPKSEDALQLLRLTTQDIDIFYEQAIDRLAIDQFQTLHQFEFITQQIGELNLVYLHLKIGEPMIREKRTGLISANQVKPIQFTPPPAETAQMAVNYAQRHYHRAEEYAKKANWSQVIAELRDALRLEPDKSEYHSLLAKAYLMQNLTGMARVHFRQALKFNPNDPLALHYAAKLDLTPNASGKVGKGAAKTSISRGTGGLFNSFFAKRK